VTSTRIFWHHIPKLNPLERLNVKNRTTERPISVFGDCNVKHWKQD